MSYAPEQGISRSGIRLGVSWLWLFTMRGMQQGWVYAFTEPYQIFILYMASEKEGTKELADLKAILDSFEVIPKK